MATKATPFTPPAHSFSSLANLLPACSTAASITVKGLLELAGIPFKMSGAQGANPPGSFTDTTYSTAPGADTQATKNKVDSKQDDKGVPVQLAADSAPNPNESAGLGGPVFGANEGPDKGVLGSSYTQ